MILAENSQCYKQAELWSGILLKVSILCQSINQDLMQIHQSTFSQIA